MIPFPSATARAKNSLVSGEFAAMRAKERPVSCVGYAIAANMRAETHARLCFVMR